jgi:hypothetical protein
MKRNRAFVVWIVISVVLSARALCASSELKDPAQERNHADSTREFSLNEFGVAYEYGGSGKADALKKMNLYSPVINFYLARQVFISPNAGVAYVSSAEYDEMQYILGLKVGCLFGYGKLAVPFYLATSINYANVTGFARFDFLNDYQYPSSFTFTPLEIGFKPVFRNHMAMTFGGNITAGNFDEMTIMQFGFFVALSYMHQYYPR